MNVFLSIRLFVEFGVYYRRSTDLQTLRISFSPARTEPSIIRFYYVCVGKGVSGFSQTSVSVQILGD